MSDVNPRAAVTRQQREDYLARITTLQTALARSRKQVVMLTRVAALHKTARDDAREDLHASRRALSAVQGLCEGLEGDGQGFVAVSDVRAALSPGDGQEAPGHV